MLTPARLLEHAMAMELDASHCYGADMRWPMCCAVQTMAQLQLSEAYKRDLLGQIQAHREAERAERQAHLEEGKKIRQEQLKEKALLETVSKHCCVGGMPVDPRGPP